MVIHDILLMKMKNTLKINDWQKAQFCFSNISAPKHFSEMVQYSKCTYWCYLSNETDPNSLGFSFVDKSGKNHGVMFFKKMLNTLKEYAKEFSNFLHT